MKKFHVFLCVFLLILMLSACAKKQGNLTFYDTKGKVEFSIEEVEGAIVWYDAKGNEVARCEEPRRDMQGRVDYATLTVNGEELTLFWSYGVYDLGMQADAPLGAFSIRGEDDRYLCARWFDPDGGIYYEVRYELDAENRPVRLYSTGAEPEFCYRMEWEFEENPWIVGSDKSVITERKYTADGELLYRQVFESHSETLDDYRDLDAEYNHFDYSFGWVSLPVINPYKMEYSEGGVDYRIQAEKKDGTLMFYEKIGTAGDKEVYHYTYQRKNDEQIIKEWKEKIWAGSKGSHYSRLVYIAGELWPQSCYEEFYDEAGELCLSLDYDAEIGYTNITQYNDGQQTVRLLREKRDARGVDGGWYWAQVEQLDENASKIEFACLQGAWPEYFLPGAVRHFVRGNESGEAERDVYFHSGNLFVRSDFTAWK